MGELGLIAGLCVAIVTVVEKLGRLARENRDLKRQLNREKSRVVEPSAAEVAKYGQPERPRPRPLLKDPPALILVTAAVILSVLSAGIVIRKDRDEPSPKRRV